MVRPDMQGGTVPHLTVGPS